MISSATSALASSVRISSMVLCSSGTLVSRFISCIIDADIFRELAVEKVAIAVVSWRFIAVMEHLVLSSIATDFRERTTCFARVFTPSSWPFLAMAVISRFRRFSSWRTRSMSRSMRRVSVRICLCHSRAFSFMDSRDACCWNSLPSGPASLALGSPWPPRGGCWWSRCWSRWWWRCTGSSVSRRLGFTSAPSQDPRPAPIGQCRSPSPEPN
mmetsp:Transcript_72909/g.206213  ORF Transcript_72909/g.206213 Transcript_72909/m.206213 type:complete len:212 (+) Transcript_72909:138-773(+)